MVGGESGVGFGETAGDTAGEGDASVGRDSVGPCPRSRGSCPLATRPRFLPRDAHFLAAPVAMFCSLMADDLAAGTDVRWAGQVLAALLMTAVRAADNGVFDPARAAEAVASTFCDDLSAS